MVNAIYKKASPSYKEVFSKPKNYCYDEWPGTSSWWFKNMNDKFFKDRVYDDIHSLKHAFLTVNKKDIDKGRKNFIYFFAKGELFRYFEKDEMVNREEIMYVHFQKRQLKVKTTINDTFVVVPNVILPAPATIDLEFLRQYGKSKLFYSQYFKIKYNIIKMKIRAFLSCR